MTSKELIEKIKHIGVEEWRLAIEEIEKDLDRLEKCSKVLKLIIRKNVDIVYLKIFDNYEHYSEYFTSHISKNVLSKEEFNLLKEVLEHA